MSKAESEASETVNCRELPLEESLSSGRLAEKVRHRSCVGAIGRRDPRGVTDGTVAIGIGVGEFN